MSIVEVKNLRKIYRNGTKALKGVSFEVEEGEVFGFLGPNGAGKTTTIKILTTLIKPSGGTARVCGFNVVGEAYRVRENIGVVFQEPALDSRLTGRENLDFHARLYGISRAEREERIEELLKMIDLEKDADKLVKYYSGGMKRRLEIARGLMHFPKVLFLDEPTLGLDVQTRRKIWEYIEKVREKEGVTIFLTTHYMEEAEKMCDRIAIIDHGRILEIGELEELLSEVGKFAVEFKGNANMEGVKKVNGRNVIEVKTEREIVKVVKELMKFNIESLNIRRSSLEDVFIKLTGRAIRDEKASGWGRR